MRFVENKNKKGVLVGHFMNYEGMKIEVRFSESEKYYMFWKNQTIKADTLKELSEKFEATETWVAKWIDVIIVEGHKEITNACPPALNISMSVNRGHVAQKPDGSWLRADWSPDIDHKRHQKVELPTVLELPYKANFNSSYCRAGSFAVYIAYSEDVFDQLIKSQVMLAEAVDNIIP